MRATTERTSRSLTRAGLAVLWLAALGMPAWAQQKPSGPDVWATNCGRCHRPRSPDVYTASQWQSVVTHMALTARLTPDETDAIREFLVGAVRAAEASAGAGLNRPVRLASASRNGMVPAPVCCELAEGRSVYERQCVACHGKSGKGDGPAAVALNPRPADLTNLERMATINDDSLVQVIAKGRKGMPAYEKLLTREQVLEVANYLRSLKP